MKKSQPKESTLEGQSALQDMIESSAEEYVATNGKKYAVGPIFTPTEDLVDRIYVNYQKKKKDVPNNDGKGLLDDISLNTDTRKYFAQIVAAILLNGHYFAQKLFHGIYWRYIYKFSHLSAIDYLNIVALYKKKEMMQWYNMTMALSIQSVALWTEMTKKEAEEYRTELRSVAEQRS